jgi:UDP-2,4-diacetamido-2,4,6-trideoxy-beta-L-altropyranose hydrolase
VKAMFSVCVRVDSSTQIGTGHLRRCLVLAGELKKRGFRIVFFSKKLEGNFNFLVPENEFSLIEIPPNEECCIKYIANLIGKKKADLFIVDHYDLGAPWEREVKSCAKSVVVIDDLANRDHDCDMILDQNHFCQAKRRYNGKINGDCKKLFGPKYALLREEFFLERNKLSRKIGGINKVVISMGGTDPNNLTEVAVQAILEYKEKNNSKLEIKVVVGDSVLWREKSRGYRNQRGVEVCISPKNMASIFSWADFCIGSSGSTNWERCCMGLPAVVIIDGENEREVAESLVDAGALVSIESDRHIKQKLLFLLESLKEEELLKMSKTGMNLCDGTGAIKVARTIMHTVGASCEI